jgi:NAD(P)-dependent dehydrogenase (short-subunit alcohol dehydrogenase family)
VELARTGYSVVINYRSDRESAEETRRACIAAAQGAGAAEPRESNSPDSLGARFVAVQADVSVAEDRTHLVDETIRHFGAIRALVNNAGIAPKERADITEATESSFDDLIHTNLKGPYFLTQQVANTWLAIPEGQETGSRPQPESRHIVFVSSISAATVSVNRGDYCISKAGIAMAAQLWAARLAGEGICVYEVRPGIMKTDMTSAVQTKYDGLIADGLVPQRRWGTPEDIGRGVRSLIDGDFPFSTGAVIDADGGFSISRL